MEFTVVLGVTLTKNNLARRRSGAGGVGVLPASSPRYTPRRLIVGRDSPRSELDGARNTKI